jgi:hypothetical protein
MSTGETDRYMDGWAAGRQQAERERCTGEAGRPFWQETPCPAWCTARHRDGDEPEDRNHYNDPALVLLSAEPMRGSDPKELDLSLIQHVREREPLLHLGERELRGFHLTIHEAEQLRDRLADLITAAKAEPVDTPTIRAA